MIGVIADDVTGATDVAAALSRAGLRTLLSLTTSIDGAEPGDAGTEAGAERADAIVIGLKTRSAPVAEAVERSLAALSALQRRGADRIYLKYCSTFDSTAEGNIGPVADALAARLGVRTAVTTPAAPLHGRTVYRGHLFVGDALLSDTHMREHPITPMRDSSVLRLLAPQTRGEVGLLPLETVRRGADAVRERIAEAQTAGTAHLVADATGEEDLAVLAEALDDARLVAGSAGLVGAMALREPGRGETAAAPAPGRTAIIAGSCSRRTLEQIAHFEAAGGASYRLVAEPGETAEELAARAVEWWDRQPSGASALLYSSSPQEERGPQDPRLAELYERAAGLIAVSLAERGIRRMLIAGGETSGQVIDSLGIRTALVGAEAALGAPWIRDAERELHLVLKSGNFGEPELFVDIAGAAGARVGTDPRGNAAGIAGDAETDADAAGRTSAADEGRGA